MTDSTPRRIGPVERAAILLIGFGYGWAIGTRVRRCTWREYVQAREIERLRERAELGYTST